MQNLTGVKISHFPLCLILTENHSTIEEKSYVNISYIKYLWLKKEVFENHVNYFLIDILKIRQIHRISEKDISHNLKLEVSSE